MAKQNTSELFEESSQGAVSAVTAIVFVVSMVLMLGGFVLMGYAVNPALGELEMWLFGAGLAATFLSFLLPFTILPALGK